MARKDQLPAKCRKANEPHFVWIGLPVHEDFQDNEKREKLNNSLSKIIPLYSGMSLLQPRKGWDTKDHNIFLNGSFTAVGLLKYWKAIDLVLHFWNSKKNNAQVIQKGMNMNLESVSTGTQNITGIDVNVQVHKPVRDRIPEFFRCVKSEQLEPQQCGGHNRFHTGGRGRGRGRGCTYLAYHTDRFHWSKNRTQGHFKLPTPPALTKRRLTYEEWHVDFALYSLCISFWNSTNFNLGKTVHCFTSKLQGNNIIVG